MNPPFATRFSWPMRLWLTLIVGYIVLSSFVVLVDYTDWLDELHMDSNPAALPTSREVEALREKQDPDATDAVTERYLAVLDSVWDYLKPWPGPSTRRNLRTPEDGAKFVVAWIGSRTHWFGSVIAFRQGWPMFANASRSATVARIRLLYDDNTIKDVRITGDPADLTCYGHWFEEKILCYELRVVSDGDARTGYCNLLAHRHPRNCHGAKLVNIYVYKIRYRYPDPDEDHEEVLRSQNGPPGWDKDGPFWIYDVADREGWTLGEKGRAKARERLAKATLLP